MTTSIKRARQQARLITLVIGLVCAATISCAPKPVVPSGANRVPINSDEMISQYRDRVKIEHRERLERSVFTRQIEALTQQVQDLSASVTALQLQQQEMAKGRSRSNQKILAAFPSINSLPAHERRSSPTSESPLGEEGASPLETTQILSSTQAAEQAEQRSTSEPVSCQVGASTETPQDASLQKVSTTESWKPRMIELGEREQVEVHHGSVIFRVSQRTGRSEFRPSTTLQAHLKQAMKLGHCLQVRGYTDGDKDQWIERATARQRAQKARAYLIRQGVPPDHIQITIVPVGEHVADNATKQGRAKNRRVEIEVKEQNPATVWPQWYG
ncbi:MAG TPA: OmpA family protein [Nitrospira sp.]|nr:OmpA family protein [Nitrospira sp.]